MVKKTAIKLKANGNKPDGYWTLARCKAEAKKYKTRTKWQKSSCGSYSTALKNKWVDQCCKHMDEIKKPNGYWTLARCKADAKKYKTKARWRENGAAYSIAGKNGWLDQCCGHMVSPQKPVYWTLERCKADAKKYKTKARWKENSASAYQRARKNGWLDQCCGHMVSPQKPVYWTLERCKADAKKYKTRTEWARNSGAYHVASRNGWVDQCFRHVPRLYKPHGYWTKERCIADAKKYKTKKKWEKNSGGSYNTARRNKWIDLCCGHMDEIKKPSGYWTLARCKAEAKKYKTKVEWLKSYRASYKAALKNKWINQCCKHMVEIKKPNGYWTKERCIADAKKYKTKKEWEKNSSGYGKAHRNGWLDQCCKHMVELQKPAGYWTLAQCKLDAKKYKTKVEWVKNSEAGYGAARKNGWLDQCCGHMKTMLYWGPRTIREFLFGAGIRHTVEKKFSDLRDTNQLPFDFFLPKYNLVIEYHGEQHQEGARGFRNKDNALVIKHDQMKKEYCKTKRICYIAILEWEAKTAQDVISKIIHKINRINTLNGRKIESFDKLKPLTEEQQRLCEDKSYWTLERCIADAKKYKTKSEWGKNSSTSYGTALRNKWIDLCCKHMIELRKPNGFWTLERCKADAKKYKTKIEWRDNSAASYAAAERRGWLDQCCKHMVELRKSKNYWSFETIAATTKGYIRKGYTAWKQANPVAYGALKRLNLIPEIRALFN